MATLNKSVWVSQLMNNFYPDSSFLSFARDFSQLVENDTINMAAAGADPEVLINNTTYPIEKLVRHDTPMTFELDTFETVNTVIRRPEVIEYSYSQLESVLLGHRNQLRARTAEKAAHAYAPNGNTSKTPVIATTGDNYRGRKRISVEDILYLRECFDNANIPLEGRYIVLNPAHVTDLILYDLRTFKDITNIKDGKPFNFAGFNFLQTTITPRYNINTLEKVAFGADASETDAFCSFAFHRDEVMKADGETYMYARYDDPEERGAIVGFDKRFIAMPIRNVGIGAIVSALADDNSQSDDNENG